MTELDKAEYARLESQVAEVERIIDDGRAGGGASNLLGEFLRNAKARMNEIRPEGELSERHRKGANQVEQLAVAALVDRESRLSLGEKQQYAGFLKLDYFTKANFDELEIFYANSWDKLSEGGKDQMSARIWAGIRRKEYTFDELPHIVKEKESERMYLQLTGKIEPSASLQNIPPQDRADFVREYEARNKNAVSAILSRPAFAEYSPDTREEEARRASSSSINNKADEQKKSSSASPQELLAEADLSLAGISPVSGVAGVETPTVQGPAETSVRGKA
ncbi:hypothetical protein ACFSSA_09220 [Luteolibacter algae]|uniref:Uncharacterized protein n=1 Tax=Luteolibacter algae TaxID=454151 RepID=A0ABW5DBQ3_9BACT